MIYSQELKKCENVQWLKPLWKVYLKKCSMKEKILIV